jgi:hypothetical protein
MNFKKSSFNCPEHILSPRRDNAVRSALLQIESGTDIACAMEAAAAQRRGWRDSGRRSCGRRADR